MIATELQAQEFVRQRVDADAYDKIQQYVGLLAEENARQNLVSRTSMASVWQRHIADGIQLLDHVPRITRPWLDLGSGPGLPGLLIGIARSTDPVWLIESRRKRVKFLTSIVETLDLSNVRVEGCRLEAVPTVKAGAITARAFAPLPKLLDLSARFSTSGTYWVLPKGRSAQQDHNDLPKKIRAMFHVEQSRTDSEAAILVGRGEVRR